MPDYCVFQYDLATGIYTKQVDCPAGHHCVQIGAQPTPVNGNGPAGTPCTGQVPSTPRQFKIHFRPPATGNPDPYVLYFYERKLENGVCYPGQLFHKRLNASGGTRTNLDTYVGSPIIFESKFAETRDGLATESDLLFEIALLAPFVEIKIRCDKTAPPDASSIPPQKPHGQV